MKLYYSKGACSMAPHIIINELKLPCEFVAVDLRTHKTETGEDYYAINPKGAVPVLETEDGEILTENAVILSYLADQYRAVKLLPPITEFERYRVLEWLNFITTELHKTFGNLFNGAMPKEVLDTIFIPALQKRFKFVEDNFDGKFVYGGQFTLADAYLFVMLSWAHHFKLDLSACPKLLAYHAELRNRPSIQKMLEEEGLLAKA